MSRNGATLEYTKKQKRDWRGWEWNQIAKRLDRLGVRRSEAVVLGLFGAKAHDVAKAMKHHFNLDNLYAVERDRKAIRALRRLGINTIPGSLEDVLMSWSMEENPEIDVVIADTCGPLEAPNRRLSRAIMCSPGVKVGACVAINLLRGRDASAMPWVNTSIEFAKKHRHPDSVGKNRAIVWWVESSLAFAVRSGHSVESFSAWSAPAFNSYTSATQKFDSAVYRTPRAIMHEDLRKKLYRKSVARRVAAARAHRTMRLRARVGA